MLTLRINVLGSLQIISFFYLIILDGLGSAWLYELESLLTSSLQFRLISLGFSCFWCTQEVTQEVHSSTTVQFGCSGRGCWETVPQTAAKILPARNPKINATSSYSNIKLFFDRFLTIAIFSSFCLYHAFKNNLAAYI